MGKDLTTANGQASLFLDTDKVNTQSSRVTKAAKHVITNLA